MNEAGKLILFVFFLIEITGSEVHRGHSVHDWLAPLDDCLPERSRRGPSRGKAMNIPVFEMTRLNDPRGQGRRFLVLGHFAITYTKYKSCCDAQGCHSRLPPAADEAASGNLDWEQKSK